MALGKNIQFHIDKSVERHGKWFDYSCCDIILSKNEYPDKHERIFICPIHGPFSYTFGKHKLSKAGCPFCTPLIRSITKHGTGWLIGSDTYKCSVCNVEKDINDFPPDNRKKRGHATRCRECKRKYDRERSKLKHVKEQNLEHHKKYRKSNKYKNTQKKYRLEKGLKTNIVFVECEDCDAIECVRKSFYDKRKYTDKCNNCRSGYIYRESYKGWTKDKKDKWAEAYKQKCIDNGPDTCKCCGRKYFRFEYEANHSTCSIKCRDKRRKHLKKARKRLRNKRSENHKENYNRLNVFNRDKWKCQNCGCKVQKKDIYADNAAEVDHIITLADGGKDEYWNVQTLCRKCNSNKGANSEGQLQIFHYVA